MRIVIAGPPKSGNVWSKCLIGVTYNLRPLQRHEIPVSAKRRELRQWLKRAGFPDNTIFHQHFAYSPGLADQLEQADAHIVTILRDPYDSFVSSYFAAQSRGGEEAEGADDADGGDDAEQPKEKRESPPKIDVLRGKPLDSPEVYEFLRAGGFGRNLTRARSWLQSGRSTVIRYEGLHADPVAEMTRITEAVGAVAEERIRGAIEFCGADNMRKLQQAQGSTHVRAAKVGDSRERLTPEHLAIFRELHGDVIRDLGYEVR